MKNAGPSSYNDESKYRQKQKPEEGKKKNIIIAFVSHRVLTLTVVQGTVA